MGQNDDVLASVLKKKVLCKNYVVLASVFKIFLKKKSTMCFFFYLVQQPFPKAKYQIGTEHFIGSHSQLTRMFKLISMESRVVWPHMGPPLNICKSILLSVHLLYLLMRKVEWCRSFISWCCQPLGWLCDNGIAIQSSFFILGISGGNSLSFYWVVFTYLF